MKINRLTEDTWFARVLAWLSQAVLRYRGWFLYPQVLLFAACVVYTACYLQLDTSRTNLIGPNQKYLQNLEEFKKEFPNQDDMVVIVESENHLKNRRFVECLGARLEAETNLFRDVFYKGDLKMLGSKALLFIPEAELAKLKETLANEQPFLQRFTRATNLVSLFDLINQGFRTAKREQNAENDSLMKSFPAIERIVAEATETLKRRGAPLSPGVTALFSAGGTDKSDTAGPSAAEEAEQHSYVTFAHGKIYLVTARPLRPQLNAQAVERLRMLVEEAKVEVPGLNVGVTGEIVLERDEMEQSRKDTMLASVVSLLICALIFIYGYQETGRPIKATLCLIIGVGYTMAFATWTVGHLNVLTITFVPILIGLAIDYGVHLISRYEEELRRGKSEEDALSKAMIYTGQGIVTGAFTTAGAFWAMTLTNFKGIREMGIICGGGLLVCLIPMVTMLPVLLLRGRQNLIDQVATVAPRRARLEKLWLQRPIGATALTVGLCALALTQFPKIYFDYNLLHMQSAGLPAVEFEKKLLDSANRSLLFGNVMATNQQEAARLLAELTNLPSVAGVESITKHMSSDPQRQLRIVREIKAELAPICFGLPDPGPVNLSELSQTLYSVYGYLGAAYSEVEKNDARLATQFVSLRRAVNTLHKQMLRGTAAELETNSLQLAAFQRALFNDIRLTFDILKQQDADSPLRTQDLPKVLRDRFVGATGKYLLMVYPKKDLRARENQKEFIEQVQTVYPKVSGTPIQLYYYTDLLKQSYEEAARYSLVAIVFLVLFHFRSFLCVLLALVPVAVGSIWLGGILGCFGIPLNPANIMTLPLVIGIGVTNGIQVLNRYAEEQTANILALSTGKAVVVSALTSMAGFGSLILAQHRGIQSLGYVMSFGLATCMVAGLTFLPALLRLLMPPPGNRSTANKAQTPRPKPQTTSKFLPASVE